MAQTNTLSTLEIILKLRDDASKQMAGINRQVKGLTSGITTGFGKASKTAFHLAAGLTATGTVLGGAFLNQALSAAGNMQQIQLAMETLLGSEQEAIKVMSAIKEDAAKTPFDLTEIARANQALISTGMGAQNSRDAVLDLANAVVAAGGNSEHFNNMIFNMQQIKNLGKASALDIKQFGMAGINIFQLLADSTGKTKDELAGMDITFEMISDALKTAAEDGGLYAGALEKQGNSLNLVKSNLKDLFTIITTDVLNATGIFGFFNDKLIALSQWISDNKEEIVAFFVGIKESIQGFVQSQEFQFFVEKLRAFGNWIMENREIVISFLKGLAIAFAGLAVIGAVTSAITLLMNPLSLLALAVGFLYTAWDQNWGGIQENNRA
jgi:tape measure domain-containing protein